MTIYTPPLGVKKRQAYLVSPQTKNIFWQDVSEGVVKCVSGPQTKVRTCNLQKMVTALNTFCKRCKQPLTLLQTPSTYAKDVNSR